MTKFTVSDSLSDQLEGLCAPVELCDFNGRVLLENPLGVYYSVDEDDCKVTVWAVWRTDGN